MKTWVQHSHPQHRRLPCRACNKPIVLVSRVGWVLDQHGANAYDMCEVDPFGNHAPDVGPARGRHGRAAARSAPGAGGRHEGREPAHR